MTLNLLERGRPTGVYYRKCELGLDLPAEFIYDLRSIDRDLFPIFHPYKILWDDLVNDYTGDPSVPRYPIAENSSNFCELIMGHVLTNGQGVPLEDGTWHIWRWCNSVGAWAHIFCVEIKDPVYLNLLVRRLYLQAIFNEKYGHRTYQHMLQNADQDVRDRMVRERDELFGEINKANKGLTSRVMDNFARGKTAVTNPQKETIMSGPGLKNRSRIIRPLETDDKESGIITPDKL